MIRNISNLSSDVIKFILILNMCKFMGSHADPKIDAAEIYLKMCSMFRLPKFCNPLILASYTYPLYPLPFPGQIVPIAPFPLILNPTPPNPSFTIPTMFTTQRPQGQQGQQGQQGGIPIQGGGICPPVLSVCPPAVLNGPIDPRQGILAVIFAYCGFRMLVEIGKYAEYSLFSR